MSSLKFLIFLEKKKTYMLSVGSLRYRSRSNCLDQQLDVPPQCPNGYIEKRRINSTCESTSETLGGRSVCPCNSWHTCAQQTFTKTGGCGSSHFPYIRYIARECEESKHGLQFFQTIRLALLPIN